MSTVVDLCMARHFNSLHLSLLTIRHPARHQMEKNLDQCGQRFRDFPCEQPLLTILFGARFRPLRYAFRQKTRNTSATLFWAFYFQSSTDQLSPIVHNVKAHAVLQFRFGRKSDTVISYPQHHSQLRSFEFDHNLPRLSMLVCVDHRLARNAKEMRCSHVIVDME